MLFEILYIIVFHFQRNSRRLYTALANFLNNMTRKTLPNLYPVSEIFLYYMKKKKKRKRLTDFVL